MSKVVDLRSDTVTQPVPDMRRAIAEAVVGDLPLTHRVVTVTGEGVAR